MIALGFVVLAAGAVLMLASARRHHEQARDLDEVLDLRGRFPDARDEEDGSSPAMVEGAVELAGRMVDRIDRGGGVTRRLEQARIPLRSGEYLIVTGAAALALAALVLSLTGQPVLGALAAALAVGASWMVVRRRIAKRRKAFAAQLPDALSLVASSLAAGHTFLRSVQMMCQESDPPLSEEFARVVGETQLGKPVAEALEEMAARLEIRDLDWVVQAIRIQQNVGGKLADLLHTLADFIRARDEVRREVQVLTAEGRMSAWILAALPPFLLLVLQVMNPDYVAPLYEGVGLILFGASVGSVVLGTVLILRMVKIKV